LEESLLHSDGSSGERSLTLQGDGQESGATPVPISTYICQIITRSLAEQSAGREYGFTCNTQKKYSPYTITLPCKISSYHNGAKIHTSPRFLLPGESSEVSEVEESRALREHPSPSQMDRDQSLVKHTSLTERVRATRGSNALSNQRANDIPCVSNADTYVIVDMCLK